MGGYTLTDWKQRKLLFGAIQPNFRSRAMHRYPVRRCS